MLARSPVGLLGGREVAAEPVDLALQVRGLRGSRWVRRPLEAAIGAVRLLERLRPVAVELHQLSAMDEAAAGERQQVGLLLPPAAQRGRPLTRPAHIVDLLAKHDHAAVDDPGGDRRELARRRPHHGLVEEAEALPYPPVVHQDVALSEHREREEILVCEPLADLGSSRRSRGRAVEVALRLVLEDDGHEHVALLRALPFAFEQPARAAEPAGSRSHLPAKEEMHPDPEGTAGGEPLLIRLRTEMARTLHQLQPLVLPSQHVGGGREQLEVGRGQRLELVGARQRLVGR